MDFGSSPSGSKSEGPNEQQVMSQVQGEIQLAMLQEFYTVSPAFMLNPLLYCSFPVSAFQALALNVQTIRDKCFDKCVTKPSSSLNSSEQQCLARCTDRYGEV